MDNTNEQEQVLYEYQRLAAEGKYVEAVIQFIQRRMTATFVEIARFLSSHMEVKGEYNIHVPGYENVILWAGMSEPFAHIMDEVLKSKEVEPIPTPSLTYIMDGAALNMPIASRPYPYKTLHWLPIVFNPGDNKNRPVASAKKGASKQTTKKRATKPRASGERKSR